MGDRVKYCVMLPATNYETLRDDPDVARALLESHAYANRDPKHPLPPMWHIGDVTVQLRTGQFNPEEQITVVLGVIVPG